MSDEHERTVPRPRTGTGSEAESETGTGTETGNRYRRLPAPVRREDLRTSQDVVDHPEPVGEADRERDWLLRTAGVL